MQIHIHENKDDMGKVVAEAGGEHIRNAIFARGQANIILATGASQFEMLEQLIGLSGVDWSVVTIYHLDEYCDIDIAFIGIGENGHLAFNDPPADFGATSPFLLVEPDEKSRQQQAGEGWFETVDDVPKFAISMSLHQILKSEYLLVTVPDARKSDAIKATVEGPICRECPASILRTHRDAALHLDKTAASKLEYFDF